jgi:hypothetical protein
MSAPGVSGNIIQTLILDHPNSIIIESNSMFNAMQGELNLVAGLASKNPKDLRLRRLFLRTFFALVETCIFRLKQDALALKEFSPKEKLRLKELRHRIDDKGNVIEEVLFVRTIPNLKHSFKAYTTALRITHKLDTTGSRWVSFKEALSIRHNIVHPKRLLDLIITDADWKVIEEAHQWFYSQLTELKKKIDAKYPTPSALSE